METPMVPSFPLKTAALAAVVAAGVVTAACGSPARTPVAF